MSGSFYPPNPLSVPTDITRVETRFRIRAIAVVIGIFLFLLIYLAMVTAAGYFVYFTAVEMPVGKHRYSFLVKIGLIAFSVMLFVFLLKFLFKKQQIHDPFNIRITEDQHPKLFNFIRQLCEDTKAPFPKKIFVNHECNAAVFYNTTILSLFWPVKKNLLIGLGLIDFMNLSEFKAILAHEFGHFSQKSMKLGSYIYMANRIIYDMVYQRDSWDDLLAKLLDEDDKEGKWYETYDRKVLLIHYLMAKAVNEEIKAQLLMRYGFHYQLQESFVRARGIRERVNEVLQKLAETTELEEDTAREFTGVFYDCREKMAKILEKANEMSIPTLRNMEKVKSLKHFLMENPLATITAGEWDSVKIETFIGQMETIIDRMRRLHFKSLAGILELQEQIARAYTG